MSRPQLSIVIPTLNAMPRLGECLAALVGGLGDGLVREAIVVDGGSSDSSAQLAVDMGCHVIGIPPEGRGRGGQMRAGAQAASGDWLLFLHADTCVTEGWVQAIRHHIATRSDMAGFFALSFDQSGASATRVAVLANWRARHLGLPYGDQGLLISRALYDEMGGYREIPLMEDVDLVRRLGTRRLVCLDVKVITSGAKYDRGGWWAVPMRNLFLLSAFLLGVKPETLARWYR